MSVGQKRLPKTVTTITPQRISFVGGGTDLPAFYKNQNGEVVSSAIDKYIYVTVKQHSPLFEEAYRLSYSKTEHTQSLEEIENRIARECLRLVSVEPPIYISTIADLPASSGLGSSSSFAVGLLNALHLLKGERVSAGQLAEEACHIEIGVLGNPIGKQDQYVAAFGGINHLVFKKNDRVEIDHLVLQNSLIDKIFENSLLIWSGIQRDATSVLSKQNQKLDSQMEGYKSLIENSWQCKELLLNPPKDILSRFGGLLDSAWLNKKCLEESITNSSIDAIHAQIKLLGGYGGKLCGAGGGGFFYEIIPKELHSKVQKVFGMSKALKVAHEPLGSRLLSEVY
jgi:D-glycero-alpha-D-manno-heptose-7-phosphate kinase